jgi:hypothetical protein
VAVTRTTVCCLALALGLLGTSGALAKGKGKRPRAAKTCEATFRKPAEGRPYCEAKALCAKLDAKDRQATCSISSKGKSASMVVTADSARWLLEHTPQVQAMVDTFCAGPFDSQVYLFKLEGETVQQQSCPARERKQE